jgi:hypothetical protein
MIQCRIKIDGYRPARDTHVSNAVAGQTVGNELADLQRRRVDLDPDL